MVECSICGVNYNGANARKLLLRHLRSSTDTDHQNAHKVLKNPKSSVQLKRERDARYKEKNPEQSKATKRFSKIKSEVTKEFIQQHADLMPKLLEQPQDPNLHGVSESNNRYWLLEEHLHVFSGRKEKLYSWDDANKMLYEHWKSTHGPDRTNSGDKHLSKTSRAVCSPLQASIFERDVEDGDEWDSFLRYNQALIQHYFDLQEWDIIQRNYERKFDLWEEARPTEANILCEAHFRYRKKWKSEYIPNGGKLGQRPVKTPAIMEDNPYPIPDYQMLQTRIVSMKQQLHEIMNGTTKSIWLDRALSEGWLQTRGAEEIDCSGMDACHAGYYGSRGASKILGILNTYIKDLPIPDGTQSYLKLLQYVLVPEVAIRLIMEDNSVDYDQASIIRMDSEGFGAVDDDEIYYDDFD